MSFVKREIPILLVGVIAILLTAREYIIDNSLNEVGKIIVQYGTIVASFAIGLATISLLRFHGRHIVRRTTGQYYYSIILVVTWAVFAISGVMNVSWFDLMYQTLIGRPSGANWGIMSFFMVSACYRAFRLRNLEAFAAMAGWAVVLLALAPLGTFVFGAPLSALSTFFLQVITTGSFRGFIIATAIGSIIFGLRVILGLERGAFGGGEG